MNNDEESVDIRHELLEYAENAHARANRGLITRWFPFIHQAASRLSTRTISRWLEETHNIKISPASVSKALREDEKHWEGYWDIIEPSARKFEAAHHVAMESYLFDRGLFQSLANEDLGFDEFEDQHEYNTALDALKNDWFALDDKTLVNMWKYVPKDGSEDKGSEDHRDESAIK